MSRIPLCVLLLLAALPAQAHTQQGQAEGVGHGLLHPVAGADHLLAMLAVGLWSGFVLPERVWAGAAAFLAAMAAGAGLAWAGVALPLVEAGIVASVIVFGALVLVSRRGQDPRLSRATLAAIAGFALCHGHAHGTEATGAAAAYLAGFLLATAALHALGIALARALAGSRTAQGALGAWLAAAGAWLALG